MQKDFKREKSLHMRIKTKCHYMEKFKKYKVFSMVSEYNIGVLKIVNCSQNGKKKIHQEM